MKYLIIVIVIASGVVQHVWFPPEQVRLQPMGEGLPVPPETIEDVMWVNDLTYEEAIEMREKQ